jgi:hypothetical protein
MLFVTGGLMTLCGLLCGVTAMGAPWEQVIADMPADPAVREMMTVSFLRGLTVTLGVGALVLGILSIVLGVMVRRGSMGATIGGIIVTIIMASPFGLMLLSVPRAMSMGGTAGAQALMGVCVTLVPLVLLIWQLVWLIQAVRQSSTLRAAQAQMQMQMQYWQYAQMQQQQQQYGQQNSQVRIQNSEGGGKEGEGMGGQGPAGQG